MFFPRNSKIIIQLAICLLLCVTFINGQETGSKTTDIPDFRELPKIGDGNVKGKLRERLLQNYCKTVEDCEQFSVNRIESSLKKVEVYLITRLYHFSAYSLCYKNKLYVSGEITAYEIFLTDYKILSKPDLLNNILQVYKYFHFNDSAINTFYVVDKNYLEKNSTDLKRYETGFEKISLKSINAPQLTKKDDGIIEIKFLMESPLAKKIMMIELSISPKYEFREKSTAFRFEQQQ